MTRTLLTALTLTATLAALAVVAYLIGGVPGVVGMGLAAAVIAPATWALEHRRQTENAHWTD